MDVSHQVQTDQAFLKILLSLGKFNVSQSEALLNAEITQYHKLAKKNSDTYESYSRFYSYHQFLYIVAGLSMDDSFIRKVNVKLESDISRLFVIKGTIDLAHTNVFLNHLKAAQESSKNISAVILIDYSQSFAKEFGARYKISCFGLRDYGNLLIEKYLLIAALAIKLQKNNPSRSLKICWWGIAFGMAFTYAIIKKFDKKIFTTFGTVKYCFEFSPIILDKLLTATPWLIPGKKRDSVTPSFSGGYYNKKELMLSDKSQIYFSKYKALNKLIKLLRDNNYTITSGLSREEKISIEHMEEIKHLLQQNSNVVYFILSRTIKELDFNYIWENLNQPGSSSRIIRIPWLHAQSVPSLCQNLDVFIDPTPFGAGMTACMAFASNVPILSCQDTFETPSTMTSIHDYLSNQTDSELTSSEIDIFYQLICTKKSDLPERFRLIAKSAKIRWYVSNIQQKLLDIVFLRANVNLIDNFV